MYKNPENMVAILEIGKLLQIRYLEKHCTGIKLNLYGFLIKNFQLNLKVINNSKIFSYLYHGVCYAPFVFIALDPIILHLFIHFIYRRLQLLVKNILIQIDKEIHSYHKKKKKNNNNNRS